LHYLTLNRPIPSLSGGESQRVRLASLLGSQLTGVLYVLDEPTTGLHPHDTKKLLKTLRKIQEAGNTVLVIEHDPEFIQHVDYIIDMGPGGGSSGGQILACGSPEFIAENQNSITGKYLNRHHKFETNSSLRKNHSFLAVRSAREHNLKNIDVTIPTNQLVVLTGVSGSGKSTFLFDILQKVARNQINGAQEVPGKHSSLEGLEQFDRLVTIDQRTIGNAKSTRSNVATYTKLFDFIRDLFASLPTAKAQSFDASSFSFNTSAQRCENCLGSGVIEIDMSFMPSMEKECPACNGMRFTNELLMVTFKGLSITDVLNLTVYEAQKLFAQEKKITAILDIMRQVELDYLKLGQSTATLSGGEAQRIQLAAELSKQSTKNTLYLLDEPTTGLHPKEIEKLIELLQELVQKGNTVIVIEHNLDVMCQADTIIDFGPGGGADGGTIVAQGTPQEITANKNSLTGRSLQEYISKN
jgi:excinuclease ABC subunit A